MQIFEWLADDFFTPGGMTKFSAGIFATCLYQWTKAKLQRKTFIIRWQYILVPIMVLATVFVAHQNQQNADCVREFNQVLRDRSAVTSENDQLSIQQRELIYNWMHDLIFPPPHISQLSGDDPAREKYAIDLTLQTDRQFRASLERQRENDRIRAENPLPPPTCGL